MLQIFENTKEDFWDITFDRLCTLELDQCSISFRTFQNLLVKCRNLESLSLSSLTGVFEDGFFKTMLLFRGAMFKMALRSVKYFCISNYTVKDSSLNWLLRCLPSLAEIQIQECVFLHIMSLDFDYFDIRTAMKLDDKPVKMRNNVMVTIKRCKFLY